ncbi:MAG TPA: hypothetical protein PKA77_04560 [Chitinophagaceae bacterium]|jgi:hypothetical protein|nr:hypothetical protein [Chitinophagaceae bacterium]HMU57758.1 hypothetical protein [Chitinophagaceae bacterium]
MKKTLLAVVALSFLVTFAGAQNVESIKTLLTLSQFKKAKEDLDKAMGNAKFSAKAEAYMLKAGIYAALSLDEEYKNKPEGNQLLTDAFAAYNKYKEMDKEQKLVDDGIYQNTPINLYSSYYSAGYYDYTKKNWKDGYEKLKTAVELSDYLIGKKLISVAVDTNVLILAGITAEQGGNKPEATTYYSRLADAKVGGADFESVYQFLVNYYFTHKEIEKFEKYKKIGAELYPGSEYFKYDKIDFAVGLETDFSARVKAVEEVLATDPDNVKANQILGELIYDTLDSQKEGAVMPENAEELEKRMIVAFNKSFAGKSDTIISQLFLADHFYFKSQKVNDKRAAHAKQIGAKPKPTPEDLKKRADLDKEYDDVFEQLRGPSEKAAAFYAAHGTLTAREKQQYKKVIGYLSDVYLNKKIFAKNSADKAKLAKNAADAAKYTAEQTKYAAEEKKWNDLYESIH